jgi:hypothetical protein
MGRIMGLDIEAENNIPNKFPVAFQNNSFIYHIDIESKLDELLISKIMKAKPGVVKILERKGLNLFHPFIDRIVEKHTISSVNFNKSSSYTFEKTITNQFSRILNIPAVYLKIGTKKGYLLTDAVDEGKDVRVVNDILDCDNTKLTLVCGYVCKKSNFENLKRCYPDVEFAFIHWAESDDAYWNEITRLTQLSHTRLETLDRDHCYHIYKFKNNVTEALILEMLRRYFHNLAGISCIFEEDTIKPLEEGVTSYTAYFIEEDELNIISKKMSMPSSPYFNFETPFFLRVKFDTARSLFRIMPFFEVSVNIENMMKDDDSCKELPYLCCSQSSWKKHIHTKCVQCIENNCSRIMLRGLDAYISIDPLVKIYHISTVGTYYPCHRF